MAKVITDSEVASVIKELKDNGDKREFTGFMQERKKLTKEHGHAQAEAIIKVKHKDKIDAIKAKKEKKAK